MGNVHRVQSIRYKFDGNHIYELMPLVKSLFLVLQTLWIDQESLCNQLSLNECKGGKTQSLHTESRVSNQIIIRIKSNLLTKNTNFTFSSVSPREKFIHKNLLNLIQFQSLSDIVI